MKGRVEIMNNLTHETKKQSGAIEEKSGQTAFVFQRIEAKYLVSKKTYAKFRREIEQHMTLDCYGLSTICNIYYDTETFDLVSRSLDKPRYKEKLRLRSYGVPGKDSCVYAELKKKVNGIVYKRRAAMTTGEAEAFLSHGQMPAQETQILREIDYFLKFYHPQPVLVLCYDREAFFGKEDSSIRMTIDRNIRYREEDFDLTHGDSGKLLDQDGDYLIEIKVAHAMPLWMADLFTKCKIYPISFSKYGMIYSKTHQSEAVIEKFAEEELSAAATASEAASYAAAYKSIANSQKRTYAGAAVQVGKA